MTSFQDGITTGNALIGGTNKSLSGVAPGTLGNVLTNVAGSWTSAPPATSGTVTSVSGTSGRITSTGGATPVIDIDAAYVGQSSITTLGTVTTGTWSATEIAVTKGGTGFTTYTTGDLIYASAANTLSKLAVGSNTNVLTLTAGVPTWAAPATSGTVTSVSGTSNRITSTGGATPVIDISASYVGQSSITTLGTVATGVWNGTAIDATHGGTNQSTWTTGDLLYASATNTLSKLGVGSNTNILTLVAGVPAWAAPATAGTVTSVTGTTNRITSSGGATPAIDISASYVGQSSITTLGTITTGTWTGTAIASANGGTGANNTATSGKILIGNGTNFVTSTPGYPNASATTGKFVISDGTNFIASTPTIPNTAGTSGKILVSDGTNYVSSTPTFPNASASSGKFIRSDGTNWIASTPTLPTSAGTSGKILQSDGTNYVESTPTYPSTSGSSGKVVISDGTNNVYSTPTFPNASATSGKIIKSDGTNWTASTETYAAPGTSGNVLTSDGTNWTSAAASGGTWGGYNVTTVSGTLTNAQIKALNATPVQIVAAQGAGKIIIPVQYCLKMAYGGTNVFTAAASQQIVFAYNGVSATTIVLSNAGIIASTSRIAYGQFTQSQSSLYTTYANTALQFWNSVATEITGNAANDNTMPWTVTYIVVTI